jgi:hypothetical protein
MNKSMEALVVEYAKGRKLRYGWQNLSNHFMSIGLTIKVDLSHPFIPQISRSSLLKQI